MLILAFDTATDRATSALVRDGEVLGERAGRASRVLADADELLREAGAEEEDIDPPRRRNRGREASPGCASGWRRRAALSFSLGVPVAGVSTLDALAAGAPGPCR